MGNRGQAQHSGFLGHADVQGLSRGRGESRGGIDDGKAALDLRVNPTLEGIDPVVLRVGGEDGVGLPYPVEVDDLVRVVLDRRQVSLLQFCHVVEQLLIGKAVVERGVQQPLAKLPPRDRVGVDVREGRVEDGSGFLDEEVGREGCRVIDAEVLAGLLDRLEPVEGGELRGPLGKVQRGVGFDIARRHRAKGSRIVDVVGDAVMTCKRTDRSRSASERVLGDDVFVLLCNQDLLELLLVQDQLLMALDQERDELALVCAVGAVLGVAQGRDCAAGVCPLGLNCFGSSVECVSLGLGQRSGRGIHVKNGWRI